MAQNRWKALRKEFFNQIWLRKESVTYLEKHFDFKSLRGSSFNLNQPQDQNYSPLMLNFKFFDAKSDFASHNSTEASYKNWIFRFHMVPSPKKDAGDVSDVLQNTKEKKVWIFQVLESFVLCFFSFCFFRKNKKRKTFPWSDSKRLKNALISLKTFSDLDFPQENSVFECLCRLAQVLFWFWKSQNKINENFPFFKVFLLLFLRFWG